MITPSPRFEISFYTDTELYYSSYLFTGIVDLMQEGFLSYRYKTPNNDFSEKEILYFTSHDELIMQCKKTLKSPELCKEIERNAFSYYLHYVESSERLRLIIRELFDISETNVSE